MTGTISILLVITIISVVLEKVRRRSRDGRVNAAGLLCGAITLISTLAFLLRKPGFWRVWGPLFGLALGCIAGAALGSSQSGVITTLPMVWSSTGGLGRSRLSIWRGFLDTGAGLPVHICVDGGPDQLAVLRRAPGLAARQPGGGLSCGPGRSGRKHRRQYVGRPSRFHAHHDQPQGQHVRAADRVRFQRRWKSSSGSCSIALAFFPKAWALLLVIPVPVMAAYLIVVLAPMFVEGMRAIIQAEPDYSKSLVVGTSIAIGLAFQYQLIDLPIGALWESTLQKAITSGGISVILLTLALEAMGPRRRRLRVPLSADELPRINQFLEQFSRRNAWNDQTTARLQAVAEETLLVLVDREDSGRGRRLRITAASSGRGAELEFITAPTEAGNLEDQFAMLGDPPPEVEGMLSGGDMSMRVLRHLATSVSHRQYQETEVITVQVAVESER